MPRKNNKKFDKKKYNTGSHTSKMYNRRKNNNSRNYRNNRNNHFYQSYNPNNTNNPNVPNIYVNVSYPPPLMFSPPLYQQQYNPYFVPQQQYSGQHYNQHQNYNQRQYYNQQEFKHNPNYNDQSYHKQWNHKKRAFNNLKKNTKSEMQNKKTSINEEKNMKNSFSIKLGEIDIVPESNMMNSTGTSTDFIDVLLGDIFGLNKKSNEVKKKNEAPIISENNFDLEKEYEKLPFELNNLHDLIKLGKLYDEEKPHQYGINMKRLNFISDSLENLVNVIGMNNVKQNIFNKVITYIQGLGKIDDMLNIVIQAPPGYGKTMLGYLLSEIFYKMGIIKKSVDSKKKKYLHPITQQEIDFPFIIAKRKDLIGEYLGQTAPKVEKKVKEAEGGVLFIDEAYSLGTSTDRKESYSESCLNTLNQLLSEKAGSFICIIAGYKDELKKSFFTNPGLERRFRLVFTIPKYNPKELLSIFNKMILDDKWKLADSILINTENNELIKFIDKNKDSFKYCGGDMEALLQNCRDAHSSRVIGKHPKEKKIITMDDIYKGYELFVKNLDRNTNKNPLIYSMYS